MKQTIPVFVSLPSPTQQRHLPRLAILMLVLWTLCISIFYRQQHHFILCHTNDAPELIIPSSKALFRSPKEWSETHGSYRQRNASEPSPENPRENKYRLIKNKKLAMFVAYMAMVAFFFLIFLCRLWDVVEGLVCCLCCCNCPWFWRLVIFRDMGAKENDIETTSDMRMTATDIHEGSNHGIDRVTLEQKINTLNETDGATSSSCKNMDLNCEQKLSEEEMMKNPV